MNVENEVAVNELLISRGAQSRILTGLGCTEMVSAATFTHQECYSPGSVGIPMSKINCCIVEPNTTNELKLYGEGEICFTGPTLMLGYFNNIEATDEIVKIHNDGERWLHTGDIGYMDENGSLFVTGRIKRILMTKGQDGNITKIFPDRIEKVINRYPDVSLCCVIGVPDEVRIHYPKAFIIPKAGVIVSEVLTDEILQYCRNNLPDYMVPYEIEYRQDMPRTSRGKVDYRALEELTKEEDHFLE